MYGRAGANHEFIDRMLAGDMVGALNELKKQAIAGDPTAINLYGDFAYWNCYLGRRPEQLDSYAAMQTQESRSLPAADAEWFRDAFMDDIAFDKAVVAACSEIVNVDQAFDMVYERAKQGDSTSLWLASLTSGKMDQSQQLLRAAAIAGSSDAQFQIAFVLNPVCRQRTTAQARAHSYRASPEGRFRRDIVRQVDLNSTSRKSVPLPVIMTVRVPVAIPFDAR